MPLDPKFGTVVFEVTNTLRDISKQLQYLMAENPDDTIAMNREAIEAIANMLLVGSEMIPGLYEENQTILDRLMAIGEKLNRIKE